MQFFTLLLQAVTFLSQNRDAIKTLIIDLENLLPNSNGSDKAAQVKNFVAIGMGIESQIEQVWPLVSPIFNAFVGKAKAPTA